MLDNWNHKHELSFTEDVVFKGQEIVIPKSLRHYITIAVRIGHFCIEKRAKDITFWPSMSIQITYYVMYPLSDLQQA